MFAADRADRQGAVLSATVVAAQPPPAAAQRPPACPPTGTAGRLTSPTTVMLATPAGEALTEVVVEAVTVEVEAATPEAAPPSPNLGGLRFIGRFPDANVITATKDSTAS
jgi:hypothetical protein